MDKQTTGRYYGEVTSESQLIIRCQDWMWRKAEKISSSLLLSSPGHNNTSLPLCCSNPQDTTFVFTPRTFPECLTNCPCEMRGSSLWGEGEKIGFGIEVQLNLCKRCRNVLKRGRLLNCWVWKERHIGNTFVIGIDMKIKEEKGCKISMLTDDIFSTPPVGPAVLVVRCE